MLSGSRDVLCESLGVSLCEYVSVLAQAAPDTTADYYYSFFEGARVELLK